MHRFIRSVQVCPTHWRYPCLPCLPYMWSHKSRPPSSPAHSAVQPAVLSTSRIPVSRGLRRAAVPQLHHRTRWVTQPPCCHHAAAAALINKSSPQTHAWTQPVSLLALSQPFSSWPWYKREPTTCHPTVLPFQARHPTTPLPAHAHQPLPLSPSHTHHTPIPRPQYSLPSPPLSLSSLTAARYASHSAAVSASASQRPLLPRRR